jgi:formyl-CoA transferase
MPALDGLRVLDLSQYEAGPSCAQVLAWLGADVVKVEQPAVGDPGRHFRAGRTGDALYFLTFNANKRGITLNLRVEEGKRLFLELLPRFDVLVENFSLGTMDRLGLGYETLKAIHPPLIYATVKGFGLSGPYAEFPSFELVAQAVGGAMSLTGEPGGPPHRAGIGAGDTGSGMLLAIGILAAYIQRQRTGEGQLVDVAQQEAVLNSVRMSLSLREQTGNPVPRRGNRSTVPADLYPCAPGGANDYVYLHVTTSRMVDRLLIAIDRPELASDPRFATEEGRKQNGDALWEIIAGWTRPRTKYQAMEELGAAGVPCGAVLDSSDIFSDRHLHERGMIVTMHHPERGDWEFPGPPIHMSASHVDLAPAPLLGQHTAEVLSQELGVDAEQFRCLQDQGVV